MPRIVNEQKYWYARTLLAQDLSINEIRKELDRIFGSAISPNTLIDLKREMKKSKQKKERTIPKAFKNIFGGESEAEKEVEVFNQLLTKLDAKLDSQAILMHEFFEQFADQNNMVELINKQMTSLKNFYTSGNLSVLDRDTIENNIVDYLNDTRDQLLKYLSQKSYSLEQLSRKLNNSPEILEIILDYLVMDEKVVVEKRGDVLRYQIRPDEPEITPEEKQFQELFEKELPPEFILYQLNQDRIKIQNYLEKQPASLHEITLDLELPEKLTKIIVYELLFEGKLEIEDNPDREPKYLFIHQLDFTKEQQILYNEIQYKIAHFFQTEFFQVDSFEEHYEYSPELVFKAIGNFIDKWPFSMMSIEKDRERYKDQGNKTLESEAHIDDLHDFNNMRSIKPLDYSEFEKDHDKSR